MRRHGVVELAQLDDAFRVADSTRPIASRLHHDEREQRHVDLRFSLARPSSNDRADAWASVDDAEKTSRPEKQKDRGSEQRFLSLCLPICGLPLPMASSDALRSLSLSTQRNTRSNHERA
jgi:hypothetical protein